MSDVSLLTVAGGLDAGTRRSVPVDVELGSLSRTALAALRSAETRWLDHCGLRLARAAQDRSASPTEATVTPEARR